MTGQDIEKARTAAGVNQTKLAKALGLVDRSSLCDIENGRIEVTERWVLSVMSVIHGLSINNTTAA